MNRRTCVKASAALTAAGIALAAGPAKALFHADLADLDDRYAYAGASAGTPRRRR